MKFFALNFNGVLDDILPHIETVKELSEADRVLAWQDIRDDYIHLYNKAHGYRMPSFLLSHCYGSCNHYVKPNPYIPIAGKYLVWGKFDYELAEKAGIADKTIITGTPIFSHVKPKQPHKGINIVFAPYHDDVDVEENHLIARTLDTFNATIYTKILSEHSYNYTNPVKSNRSDKKHTDIIFDLLSKADIVVVNDPISTFVLYAFAAGIPVICVKEQIRYNNYAGQSLLHVAHAFQTGVYDTTITDLHATIEQVLSNDTKQEQRQYWLEYMGATIKDPLKNILQVITN